MRIFAPQAGEGVPTSLKGAYARHTPDVANFFRVSWGGGARARKCVSMTTITCDHVTISSFHFTYSRAVSLPPVTPFIPYVGCSCDPINPFISYVGCSCDPLNPFIPHAGCSCDPLNTFIPHAGCSCDYQCTIGG